MDNVNNFEELSKYQEQLKDYFKDWATPEFCDKWADTFEIASVDEKQITVAYFGDDSVKAFKKECEVTLSLCLYSILGEGKKIKIIKKSNNTLTTSLSPKAKKNIKAAKFFTIGMVFVCFATAVIVVMCNYIGNRNFRETFYNTSSIKVDSEMRVIQLSDMHGVSYGKGNKKLVERIAALKPDVIVCTGDMVDSVTEDADYAVSLAAELAKIAPSYYVYGNNEADGIYDVPMDLEELDAKFGFNDDNRDETALLKTEDDFEKKIEATGMKVLKNEKDTITVKSITVDVYGVLTSNPSSFWPYSGKSFAGHIYENSDNFKITAVHEPFIFEELHEEFWGDLMVCGHTHGGVVRVPVLGPLYTREGGLFPERSDCFVYGRYNTSGGPLIVSGGLENNNLLRINNQPELVVIDINKF